MGGYNKNGLLVEVFTIAQALVMLIVVVRKLN